MATRKVTLWAMFMPDRFVWETPEHAVGFAKKKDDFKVRRKTTRWVTKGDYYLMNANRQVCWTEFRYLTGMKRSDFKNGPVKITLTIEEVGR